MQDIFDGECGLNVGIWVEHGHVLREALPYSCWGLSNTSMDMILLCMRHHCELMMVYYPHTTSSRQSIHRGKEFVIATQKNLDCIPPRLHVWMQFSHLSILLYNNAHLHVIPCRCSTCSCIAQGPCASWCSYHQPQNNKTHRCCSQSWEQQH